MTDTTTATDDSSPDRASQDGSSERATDGGTVTEAATTPAGRPSLFDRRLLSLCLGSVVVVLSAALVQVSFGTYSMTLPQAWSAVFSPDVLLSGDAWRSFLLGAEMPEVSTRETVVWNIRLPRVILGVLVGANLAVSGAIFQAVTRNELASPFVLGVSSGAGLAVLLGLIVFSTLSVFLPLLAAGGGAAAFLLVYAIAWQNGTNPVRLVLAGVIVGTMFGSLQTALFFFAENLGVVQSAIAWTTGSLTGRDWEQVRLVLPWTIGSLTFALLGSRQLNVLLLGETTAKSLGMSVERVRFLLSGVAVVAAAASIAVAGIVGFVGLIVPHAVRTVVGSDYRRVLIGCVFAGPALLSVADLGARLGLQFLTGSPTQIPVGVVTGIVGGPYFLYLMRRRDGLGEI